MIHASSLWDRIITCHLPEDNGLYPTNLEGVMSYLDDLLITGSTVKEHMQNYGQGAEQTLTARRTAAEREVFPERECGVLGA